MCFSASAQTDSTAIKLKEYKSLYEQQLIDSNDYQELKASLLFNGKRTQKQTPEELKKKYKSFFIAGGIFMGAGIGLVAGGVVYSPSLSGAKNVATEISLIKTTRRALIAMGSISMVAGAVFTSLGISNKVVYQNQKELTIGILDSGQIGLAFNL